MALANNLTVEVRVDGMPCSVTAFICHYQEQPFTKTHRFELVLRDPAHMSAVWGARPAPQTDDWRPDGTLSRSATSSLFRYLGLVPLRPGPDARYLLNQITAIRPADDHVIIEGICSELDRRSAERDPKHPE